MILPPWVDKHRYEGYQLPIAEEILGHYRDGAELVVLDAPTGSGKTLIADMVRQHLQLAGLYLCTTLTLMDQFFGDFPSARIKGRANYTPTNVIPDEWGVHPTCADCDWNTETGCSYCPSRNVCPYPNAKAAALEAERACSNTSYFLGECNGSRSQFSGAFPFITLDEADSLEGEVMNQVSVSISPRMMKYLNLQAPRHKTVESSWAGWFEDSIPVVRQKLLRGTGRQGLQEKRRTQALERLLTRMEDVAEDLEGWVYTGYDQGKIEFRPVTVDKIAPDHLWRHGKRWLAMSATILSPEEFVSSLGFTGQWAPVFAPSAFAPERRPVYYCPSARMVKKEEVTAWPKMGLALVSVLQRHPDESVLVHTHSYSLTQYLSNYLLEHYDDDRSVYAYANSKEREGAIASFENEPGSVLLAPSLDRGYDGADEKVRVIAICKVPFPYLGDKQVSTRLYSTPNGKLWYATLTCRSVAQMVGRGMRHENDTCTTYILDSEFGRFFAQWRRRGYDAGPLDHELFPKSFCEALHFESDERFELRQAMRGVVSSG